MKQLVINKNDLKHNINKIKDYAKQTSRDNKEYTIIGVIKGNGYGLGLIEYAKFLIINGIENLAVATLEEAMLLRKEKINNNILLLSALNDKTEIEKAVKNKITVTISSEGNAIIVNELAKKGYNIKAHIKIDTGFGRYGFIYNDSQKILKVINNLNSKIEIEGIFSHFSIAYYKKNKHTIEQFKRFKEILKILEENNIKIKMQHICNSPAFLNYPEMHLNSARIGSAFTGRVHAENKIGLKKIGELTTAIAEIKQVPKKFNISYANAYTTKTETKIAILPIGYIEGYNVGAKTDMFRNIDKTRKIVQAVKSLFKKQKLTVEINDKRYNIIGTIGMYHTIVDITGTNIKDGDVAILETNPLYVPTWIRREYK